MEQDFDKAVQAAQIEQFEQFEQLERRELTSRATFGQKAKRHFARWWWLHILLLCVCFLVTTLCLIYIGMPRLAQKGVDESTIKFTELQFLDPAPGFITITQTAVLHNSNIFTPILDPFNASLYLVTNGVFGPVPIATLTIPRAHVLRPTSSVNILGQRVAITNQDQLTEYATQALTLENVTTALTGVTQLHEGHLPVVDVHFNSSTTYQTLDGLNGFNITGLKLNLTVPAGEPNLHGYVYIPNPSALTIALGNVTLSLATSVAGVVGNTTILDLTIKPGNNTVPMAAILDSAKALNSLDKNGFMEVLITGTSVVYNEQHITYYEKALAANVLNLTLNVKEILANSA